MQKRKEEIMKNKQQLARKKSAKIDAPKLKKMMPPTSTTQMSQRRVSPTNEGGPIRLEIDFSKRKVTKPPNNRYAPVRSKIQKSTSTTKMIAEGLTINL